MGGLQVAAAAAGADKDASARVDVDDKSKQQEAAAVLNMSSPRPCPPPRNPQQRSCFLLLKLSGPSELNNMPTPYDQQRIQQVFEEAMNYW